MLHRRMVVHRKDKGKTGLFEHLDLCIHPKVETYPQCFEKIRRTGVGSDRSVTMLGDHTSQRCQEQ